MLHPRIARSRAAQYRRRRRVPARPEVLRAVPDCRPAARDGPSRAASPGVAACRVSYPASYPRRFRGARIDDDLAGPGPRGRSVKAGRRPKPPARVLGWREWARLPEFGVRAIKVKLDTGARTSALHAFGLRPFTRDGKSMVRFEIHPVQRSAAATVAVEADVLDERIVRNSGGHEELRPVIRTMIEIGGERWPIELTLTQRDQMGFRMLLGRQALRGRVVVDAGSSFRAGRPGSGAGTRRHARREREEE